MKPSKIILSQMYFQGTFIGNTQQLSETEFETQGFNKASQECVTKPVEHWTDWYRLNSDGDWVYTHSVLNYITYESVCHTTGGGGNTGGTIGGGGKDLPHGGGGPEGEVLVDREDRILEEDDGMVQINIDPQFLRDYPCISQEIQKAYELCSKLNIEFLEYFESSDLYNVIYGYLDLNSNTVAQSTNPVNCSLSCNIQINFNQDYFGTISDLGIANSTIHENVHAMLFYLWRSGEIALTSSDPTYRDLAQAYCNLQASEDFRYDGTEQTLNDLGHEYMVDLADQMAGTLFNYATSRGIDVDISYCTKMIWGGTFSTLDNYNKKFNIDERNEIAAIVNAELNNESYTFELSDGAKRTISAKGDIVNSDNCN